MDLFDKFYLWNRKTYKIGNNTAIHFMHKFSTVYKMPELADKTQMAGRFGLPFSLKISNFAQILAYGKER